MLSAYSLWKLQKFATAWFQVGSESKENLNSISFDLRAVPKMMMLFKSDFLDMLIKYLDSFYYYEYD